jgi:hypothetical protein
MTEANPRITRRPKWILTSANWEKYQYDLETEMSKLQQPISTEKMTRDYNINKAKKQR